MGAPHGSPPSRPDSKSFETKLSPELRIRQTLNRLTFGARPGDFEEVHRLGVEKWIELQLHPERVAENPMLEARLKPLESIRLDSAEIIKRYFPQFPPGLGQRMIAPVEQLTG